MCSELEICSIHFLHNIEVNAELDWEFIGRLAPRYNDAPSNTDRFKIPT